MEIDYIEIGHDDGTIRHITEEELRRRLVERWYSWLTIAGKLIGWSPEETANHVNDPNWFACFDDGLTPEEAVQEARNKGVI